MKSPFPGMDPYLEPHWRDVHASLTIYARDQMQQQLPSELLARVEERVFVESDEGQQRTVYPDVRETFIQIIDAGDCRVVTVVEFLSLANKQPGDGQDKYLQKQQEMRAGKVNVVEIDLLRAGQRVFMAPAERIPAARRTPYQACIWRARHPEKWEHFAFPLHQRLPAIRIPLREQYEDVLLHLQPLIEQCYINGRYQTLDYRQPPQPALTGDDALWADQLLREAGKR